MQTTPSYSCIAAIAAGQHGHFTLDQARSVGMSRRQIAHNIATGRWASPHTGVFRVAGTPATVRSKLMAATLATGSGAAASHRSAAWMRSLVDWPPSHLEVIHESLFRPDLPGVRVHLTR